MIWRYSSVTVLVFVLLRIVKSDFFTAVADLEKLLLTEKKITNTLEKIIENEEKRLEQVKRTWQRYAKLQEVANKDIESFLSNPVNAFLLIKYLTADWERAIHLIKDSEIREIVNEVSPKENLFPDENDLAGAATSLMRMQKIYQLDTSTIALGNIGVINSSLELTASDCFELGKQARNGTYRSYGLEWLQESLKRLEKEHTTTVDKVDILESIVHAAYDVGNFTHGLTVTEEILKINPKYPRVFDNLKYMQKSAVELLKQKKENEDLKNSPYIEVDKVTWTDFDIDKAYERLCRGETKKTAAEKSKLFCHYTSNNNKYLLIQPVKTEVVNLNPRIVLYHDIIRDSESKIIKDLALPELMRAVVTNAFTGETEETTDRISKSALLSDNDHEVLTILSKRAADISGLATESAEPAHVINYGIGGHYEPHFDFAQIPENIEIFQNKGNRIATFIFYLSDVPAGGSTVFPLAEVEIKPVKGSAVFWYNLLENGEGNGYTLHAACPVLTGSKWIATKWLHEEGQEFKRPCNLDPSK